MTEIITRFAPSPTGNLHLGSARTALINFIISQQNLSSKFYNVSQLVKLVSRSLNQNMNFSRKIARLKKTGSNILGNTLSEINCFL